jgi:hypothetical protein
MINSTDFPQGLQSFELTCVKQQGLKTILIKPSRHLCLDVLEV